MEEKKTIKVYFNYKIEEIDATIKNAEKLYTRYTDILVMKKTRYYKLPFINNSYMPIPFEFNKAVYNFIQGMKGLMNGLYMVILYDNGKFFVIPNEEEEQNENKIIERYLNSFNYEQKTVYNGIITQAWLSDAGNFKIPNKTENFKYL